MTGARLGLFAITMATACDWGPQYCEGDWAAAPLEAAPPKPQARVVAQVLPATSNAVDILFVVDNSTSMAPLQHQLAVGFDGINPYGFFRRVYIPSVLSVASVTTAYRRAAAERQYAVQLRAVCDPSLIVIRDKKTPHT